MRTVTLKTLQDVELSLAVSIEATLMYERRLNKMESEITQVKAKYSDELSGLASDIMAEDRLIKAYLKTHKEDFDGPPRSVELPSGTIGYRLGQKHLKPLSKWSWAKVLAKLQADKAECYLRPTVEVDRDALLADAKKQGDAQLRKWGLKAAQDDKPFIDLKREESSYAEEN